MNQKSTPMDSRELSHEPAASPVARPRRRAVAHFAVVLALVGALLAPAPAAPQQDGGPGIPATTMPPAPPPGDGSPGDQPPSDGEESPGDGEESPGDGEAEVPVEVPVEAPPADPVFSDGAAVTLSIAEDHADGASVGTVAATDANGDTLTYSLSGDDAASFTIDTATGEVSVVSGVSLDFETKASHSVTVGVSDGNDADGNPETSPAEDATIAVTIEVTDAPGDETESDDESESDEPESGNERRQRRTGDDTVRGTQDGVGGTQAPEVPSGCPTPATGDVFASVTATASTITVTGVEDFGQNILSAWSLRVCTSAGVHWALNDDSARIRNASNDSGFAGETFTFSRIAPHSDWTDVSMLTAGADYWVYVNSYAGATALRHVNTSAAGPAAPVFSDGASTTLMIAENNADGASVGTVAATDANGDTLTYSLSGDDAASFSIDTATGELSVASGVTLDFETKSSYSVTVGVTDGKDSAGNDETTSTIDATISVTISVTDVPDITLTLTDSSSNALSSLDESDASTAVTVTATLTDGAHTAFLTVALSVGGTAVSGTGNDYLLVPQPPGAVPITMGQLSGSKTIQIDPLDDADFVSEVIEVTGTAAGFEVAPATLTLNDDDLPAIMLSLAPASADEDDASTEVTVTATRDASAASAAVTVQLAVDAAASTATSGTDYAALGTLPTVSLSANQTSNTASFNIDPTQDSVVESGGETIVIGGTASGFNVTPATFTINDDDSPSTSWTLSLSPVGMAESAANTTVTVKATLDGGALASAVTVTFAALGGTATPGVDYAATDATTGNAKTTPDAVTITAGQTEASTTIKIAPTQDNRDENDETIIFSGTASGGLTTTEEATLTIADDDTASTNIALSVDTDSTAPGRQNDIGEGDSETTVTVTATLAGTATYLTDQTVAVQVVSAGSGSATPGADATTGDYRLKNIADVPVTNVTLPITLGNITIPAGSFSKSETFKVTPNDDSTSEPTETIRVDGTLTGFDVAHADISLVDDDLPPLTLSSTTTSLGENDASGTSVTVTATVAQNTTARVDVTLTFDGGSAKKGIDFSTSPATVTVSIPSGQKTGSKSFTINPIDDRIDEGTGETIVIGGSHDDYSVATHSITLTDDDEPSTAVTIKLRSGSAELTSLAESAANTTVTVIAELNRGTLGSDVTVTFAALGGDADGGGTDYSATDATTNAAKTTPDAVTITAGQTQASTTIKINPVDDDIDEGTGENISFTATLTGALTGAATGATLRITDNDTAQDTVNLSVSPTKVSEAHSGEATVTVTATVPGGKTHETAIVVPVRVVAATSPKRSATPSAMASTGDYTLKNFADNAVTNVTLPIALGSITIPAEMSSATETFKIDPRNDTDFEGTYADHHEYVRISAGAVAGFTVNHTDLEITENDNPGITLTVDTDTGTDGTQTSVPESAGTRTVRVTATLDHGARSSTTIVELSFAGATRGPCSTAGNDYNASTTNVIILPNQTSRHQDISITVCDDRVTETGGETVTINGTLTGFDVSPVTFTIDDNDTESTTLTITATPSPLDEDDDPRSVTVEATLDGGTLGTDVTVTFDALAGEAMRGADTSTGDYTSTPAKPAAVTISSGDLSASTTIDIDPRDDTIDEDDETITFGASAARADNSNALTVTSGTLTITDNDTATVTLEVDTDLGTGGAQTSIGEGDAATIVRISATLSTSRSADTTLAFNIDDTSTADRDVDYTAPAWLGDSTVDITIAAGSTTGTADVKITPIQDRFDEGTGQTIVIDATASGGLAVTTGTVTITDDDAPSTAVTLTVDTDTMTSGNQHDIGEGDGDTSVLVTATLDDAVRTTATTVTLTLSGTAGQPSATGQYNLSGTLAVTIPANEVSGTRTVTITPDDERVDDGNKTIIFGGNFSGLTVVSADAITLADDDDPPTALKLTVDPVSVREQGPAGGGGCEEGASSPGPGCDTTVTITASFTGTNSDVTRVTDTAVTLSVLTGTAGGSATRGATGDYTAPAALGDSTADITIGAGSTSASTTIVFTSRQDNVNEGAETIIIDGAATGFTVAAADRATITMTDDDSASTSLTLTVTPCDITDPVTVECVPRDEVVRSLNEYDPPGNFFVTAELDGSTSTSAVNVTLTLSGTATAGLGKDYQTVDDLTDSVVDITIPATEQSATMASAIYLAPVVDGVDDDDEIIRIGGTADLASINTVNHWDITIIDHETASMSVALTKSSGLDSFTEDHGTGVPYQVVATLDGDVAHPTDTQVALSLGGTATLGSDCNTAGVDYTASPNPAMITIRAEATTGDTQVTLTPCNPATEDPEPTKTIEFGGTATFGDTTVAVTSGFTVNLIDDDLPTVTLSAERVRPDGPDNSVREGESATFRVTAGRDTGQSTERLVVPLSLQDESTAGSGDYRLSGLGTITIPAGEASASRDVTLTTIQDQQAEGDETVLVGGRIGDGTEFAVTPVTFTINDDDVPSTEVAVSVNRPAIPERAGRTRVTVTAMLDAAPLPAVGDNDNDGNDDNDVVVTLNLTGGTATVCEAATESLCDDTDYRILDSSTDPVAIRIPAGRTRGTAHIDIDPVGDDIDEGNSETIRVTGTVTAPAGSTLTVTGTPIDIEITDDDTASGVIELSVDTDADENGDQTDIGEADSETTVTVTATVSGRATYPGAQVVAVTVVAVPSGGATPSANASSGDYRLKNFADSAVTNVALPISLGSITIPAGMFSQTATFKVTPNGDTTAEGNEIVELSGAATGLTVWGATLAIVDDDVDHPVTGESRMPGQVVLNTPARPPGSTSATLSWPAPTNPPDPTKGRPGGYRVERRSAASPEWVAVTTIEANPTRYTVTDPPDPDAPGAVLLDPDEDYEWRVTAFLTALPNLDPVTGEPLDEDGDGEIDTTACECAATPSEPKSPTAPRPPGGGFGGGGGGGGPAPEAEVELPDPSRPQPPADPAALPGDVSEGSVHAGGILAVLRLGVMTLVSVEPDPEAATPIVIGFAPGRSMTRGDVAAPLVRLWQVLDQDCPDDAAEPFGDISDLQVAADAGCLRGVGITSGTTATTYSPERLVTRAQTASLLVRVWRLLDRDCPADGAPPFDDVAEGNVHRDDILCLRALGITAGTGASTFTPERHVTRAEFATMLARLHNLISPPTEPEEPELPDPSRPQPLAEPVALPGDVSEGSVHAGGILAVLRLGVMTLVDVEPAPGAPVARGFAPGRSMTRGDVAAPLVRLWQVLDQDCPTDAGDPFGDISDLQVAADAGCLRGVGITSGTTATTYSPERLVTRAQTASLLVRVWRLLDRDCPADGAPPFDDVAEGNVHRDDILCLRALGIVSGTGATTFSPERHVTRAEFATMLARLHNLINPPPEPDPAGQ